MIRLNIVINVTNSSKSIRPEVGDRSEPKRVSSGAKWLGAVIVSYPWVSKMLNFFFGSGDADI